MRKSIPAQLPGQGSAIGVARGTAPSEPPVTPLVLQRHFVVMLALGWLVVGGSGMSVIT